jgi:trehalose 6-phosphate phosphatase
LRLDAPTEFVDLSTSEIRQVGVLKDVLSDVAESIDQVWIEPKPTGFALHTRLATEANSRIAHLEALEELGAELDEYTVRTGKDVLEFSVRHTTKGDALAHLRNYTGSTAVFFAGDDVTDEDAFAALEPDDVGLKSGEGATLANFRVKGPTEIARAIALLADLREGDVHEQ